jgi:hypothetical protein
VLSTFNIPIPDQVKLVPPFSTSSSLSTGSYGGRERESLKISFSSEKKTGLPFLLCALFVSKFRVDHEVYLFSFPIVGLANNIGVCPFV